MEAITLAIFAVSAVVFLAIGYRLGRLQSPVAPTQPPVTPEKPAWAALRQAVGDDQPEEKSPEKKPEKSRPLQLTKF